VTQFVLKGSGCDGDTLDLRDLLHEAGSSSLSSVLPEHAGGGLTTTQAGGAGSHGGCGGTADTTHVDTSAHLAEACMPGCNGLSAIHDLIQQSHVVIEHG
jgi:hypothetical protein